ncbi:MAG: hypothetical protein ACRDNZ_08310 [Streptosporangiaceae bacterium]
MEAATSGFDNEAKQLLEEPFGMSTGYVMDFNGGTFASFVQTCIGVNPYDRYDGSKAAILCQLWLSEPFADVAELDLDLLERWRINKLRAGQQPTEFWRHPRRARRGDGARQPDSLAMRHRILLHSPRCGSARRTMEQSDGLCDEF